MSYFRRTLGQTGQTVHSTPPASPHNREESNVATVQTVSYEKGALSQLPSSLCKDSIIFKYRPIKTKKNFRFQAIFFK